MNFEVSALVKRFVIVLKATAFLFCTHSLKNITASYRYLPGK